MTTEMESGKEEGETTGPAQERVPGATPGGIPSETPGAQGQDRPAVLGGGAEGGGCVPQGKRDRATATSVTGPWRETAGVVYLFRCSITGEYKFGGTTQPGHRYSQLVSQAKVKLRRDLVYLWSTITNGVGRLELYWLRRWEGHRVDGARKEWASLPDSEVRAFQSATVVTYRDLPPVPTCLLGGLRQLPADHSLRYPASLPAGLRFEFPTHLKAYVSVVLEHSG